ncbi:ABC transporter ATP-binding protein [Microbacterium sp. NPDC055683]
MTSSSAAPAGAVLAAEDLVAGYGVVSVLDAVSLHVAPGEIVALLGRNGAGKSTTLGALSGMIPARSGRVFLGGVERRDGPAQRARAGLSYVIEERGVLLNLTAGQNLLLGRGGVAEAVSYFPEIRAHLGRPAGLLSGGQQQMLAVARALAGRPVALMVDELSLGLAPRFVERLMDGLRRARDEGVGILLVEQHARSALRVADRAYVLTRGQVALSGRASDLLDDFDAVEAAYLGGA